MIDSSNPSFLTSHVQHFSLTLILPLLDMGKNVGSSPSIVGYFLQERGSVVLSVLFIIADLLLV
jgi:hypothetical protein